MSEFVKLDGWLRELIVDPLDKGPLVLSGSTLVSSYGRRYPVEKNIYDLRLLTQHVGVVGGLWQDGQHTYEHWTDSLAARDSKRSYEEEKESVREVYRELPIVGRCLDVGGHQGRLREFLEKDQEYVSIDPFRDIFQGLAAQTNLLEVYSSLRNPVNFLCAFAEHLPLKNGSFDTAHMRSCIDHFYNPEAALLEAYRVLRRGGQLIVGLYVEGGRTGVPTLKERCKEGIRGVLSLVTGRYKDHHIWHPTYDQLCALVEGAGFHVERTYWQPAFIDRVCYIRARKS
jgi:ubiquinone/menaquinone biosynthesis C-methylase UbiE